MDLPARPVTAVPCASMTRKPIKFTVKPGRGRDLIHLAEIKRRGAGTGKHKTAKDRPRKNQVRRWEEDKE